MISFGYVYWILVPLLFNLFNPCQGLSSEMLGESKSCQYSNFSLISFYFFMFIKPQTICLSLHFLSCKDGKKMKTDFLNYFFPATKPSLSPDSSLAVGFWILSNRPGVSGGDRWLLEKLRETAAECVLFMPLRSKLGGATNTQCVWPLAEIHVLKVVCLKVHRFEHLWKS